jgi:hypothetical protein
MKMTFLFYLVQVGFMLFLIFRLFTRDSNKAAMGVMGVFVTGIFFLILGWSYILTVGTAAAWIPWVGLIGFILITLFTVF